MVLGRKCLVAQPQHFTGNESVSFLICSDNVIMPCGSHHAGHVQGCRRLALGQRGVGGLQSPSAPSDYITIRAKAKSTHLHKYKAERICCNTKIRSKHLLIIKNNVTLSDLMRLCKKQTLLGGKNPTSPKDMHKWVPCCVFLVQ